MHSLATLRTSELFDLIVDYPDSLPALADLKECLVHTHQYAEAVQALAEAIDTRLLKPGADTANIIQVYVSAIKALRHLDPTGVISRRSPTVCVPTWWRHDPADRHVAHRPGDLGAPRAGERGGGGRGDGQG